MKGELRLYQVEAINHEIQAIIPEELQSIDVLNNLMLRFASHLAFTGEQMAIAKKVWRDKQKYSYDKFAFNSLAQNLKATPTLIKEYVNARCGDLESDYEMIERTNRSLVHSIDAIRTCISALKEQLKNINA